MNITDLPQYRPLHKIAKGGLTDLFVCTNAEGKRVVVRFVKEQHRKDKSIIKSFKKGLTILQKFDNPCIIKVLDTGMCKGFQYMVIQYHDSENLRECILHQNPILKTNSLTFVRKLAAAINYIHSQGYLHMDLKPENILIKEDGGLILIDFDFCIPHKGSKPIKLKILPGTPTYLAPETLLSKEVDERSEVFSFGVIVYELLTHHKPFEANSITEYKRAVADPRVRAYPLHERRQDISKRLEAVIEKCLAKRKEERYPSMALVLRDLEALL
ncbi:serine/threonine-protein kinase [Kiritimatiellaeota bacterium B1221]|nr:serine/threonine-protein kinase [Kiritimatiellaeota bacterium B1221]